MKFTLVIATLAALVAADVSQPPQSLSATEINSQYEAQNLSEQLKVFHQDDVDNVSEDDEDDDEETLVQDDDDEEEEESDDDDEEANILMDDEADDDEDDDVEEDESEEDDEDILTADE